MSEHQTCSVGVNYDTFEGTEFMSFDKRPCFSDDGKPRPGCDLVQMPTAEEVAARYAKIELRLENLGKARMAIVAACGGPWTYGMTGQSATIDCPACQGVMTLSFSRAGCNGHIHARCSTPKCVSWME